MVPRSPAFARWGCSRLQGEAINCKKEALASLEAFFLEATLDLNVQGNH